VKAASGTVASAVGLATVIALGLSAGAMLAEGAVLVPFWRSIPPTSFLAWYAANAQRLLDFFGPLEVAGALLAIAAAVLHRKRTRAARWAFTGAAVLAVGVLVPFPLYFQAVNASFADGSIELARVPDELQRWALWHGVRTGIGLGAFVAALIGVRRVGR
jgi:hypothetical protein